MIVYGATSLEVDPHASENTQQTPKEDAQEPLGNNVYDGDDDGDDDDADDDVFVCIRLLLLQSMFVEQWS